LESANGCAGQVQFEVIQRLIETLEDNNEQTGKFRNQRENNYVSKRPIAQAWP